MTMYQAFPDMTGGPCIYCSKQLWDHVTMDDGKFYCEDRKMKVQTKMIMSLIKIKGDKATFQVSHEFRGQTWTPPDGGILDVQVGQKISIGGVVVELEPGGQGDGSQGKRKAEGQKKEEQGQSGKAEHKDSIFPEEALEDPDQEEEFDL